MTRDELAGLKFRTARERKAAMLALPPEERVTEAEQEAILTFVAANRDCSLTALGEATSVRRYLIVDLLERDKEFKDLYKEARGHSPERVRGEAFRRAVDGWDEPIYQGGKKVGVKRVFSDYLLGRVLTAEVAEYAPAERAVTNVDVDITVDQRQVNLAGAIQVLARAGALDEAGLGELVSAAREVLPAPAERPAAGVSAPPEP